MSVPYHFSGRTEFQAAVSASLGRDRSISFERRPSQRYPRRGKINSNRASTGTLNVDISPHQPNIVRSIITNNPESLLENTTLPEVHHQSNMSLNQREEQVILPNPNHQFFDPHHATMKKQVGVLNRSEVVEESREKGIVVDVHRTSDERDVIKEKQYKANRDSTKDSNINNLHFDLHNQPNRSGNSFPHSVISKRISSSSSGGYSATDEVDYLKWVSETKGQVKHHINKKIVFATDGDCSERQERNGNKSLNSSSSGVSSVESCPSDGINLDSKGDPIAKQYPASSSQKGTSSRNSSSSGHGSPEDSVMTNNMLNRDEKSSGTEKNEIKKESLDKHSKRTSPVSSISRVNSSSPDSGYEHLSSTGAAKLIYLNFFW